MWFKAFRCANVLNCLLGNFRPTETQLEKEILKNEKTPTGTLFLGRTAPHAGIIVDNVVHTVRWRCGEHGIQVTGKASSHSLLWRITWPRRRKVVRGLNSVNQILDMTHTNLSLSKLSVFFWFSLVFFARTQPRHVTGSQKADKTWLGQSPFLVILSVRWS